VTVELGGKSPNVVFADADLERAVPAIVGSIVQNAGQTCSAGARLLVEEPVYDRVRDAVAERFRSLTVGHGLDDPDVGPLISERQRDRVASIVEAGRSDATVFVGGAVLDRPGYFFEATLFDDVRPGSAIATEEVFGPVLAMAAFRDVDQAVALANATQYGLVAGIWTRDIGKAHTVAAEIAAGQVFINTYGAGGGVELPFGGFKMSGYGREKGIEGLVAYTRTKTVAVGL
jgi:aldehyde dehydrogenase (NAD+)/betaine-aldehyde dehydrogenase